MSGCYTGKATIIIRNKKEPPRPLALVVMD
jgi:hypothetical protein